MSEDISVESTKEEIAEYFLKIFKIPENARNNLIQEDISGDILLDLTDADFYFLDIRVGQKLKIQKYLEEHSEKFKPKEIQEKITSNTNREKVKIFFEKCLDFKGNLNNMNGKGLIDLEKDEEEMKKLGLNLGQRKKIIKYINHFKTLKEEPEDYFIYIDEKSSDEDIEKFLKYKSKLSKESIDSLGLDAESLFLLNDEEINKSNIKKEEKESLKKSLKELKMNIDEKSTKEEVTKFLKIKLGVMDDFIEKNDLNGKKLISLELEEIDKIKGINQEKKDKFKNILIELKQKQKVKQNMDSNNPKINSESKQKEKRKEINDQQQELNKIQKDKLKQEENQEEIQIFNQDLLNQMNNQDPFPNKETNSQTDLNQKNNPEENQIKSQSPLNNSSTVKKNENEPKSQKKTLQSDTSESKEKKKFGSEINITNSEYGQQKSEFNINIENSAINLNKNGRKLKQGQDQKQNKEMPEIKQEMKIEEEPELEKEPEPEIRISFDSTKEEIANFLGFKLGFKDNIIEKLDFNGKTFFTLDEEDVKYFEEINEKQKIDLISILKEINIKISEQSNSEEVAKFLKITLGFNINSIKELNLTGKKLFSLKEEDINKMEEISKEEKDKLKNYLNIMNINITKTSDKNDVSLFLKIKLKFSYKSIKELNMDGENLFLLDEEELDTQVKHKIKKEELIILKQFLKKVKKPKEGIQKMNQKSKYNVFFPLCILEKFKKYIIIKTYEKGYFQNTLIENDIIHVEEYSSTKNEKVKFHIYHVHSNKKISYLQIIIKDKYKNIESESRIELRKNSEIYFLVDNISFYGRTPYFNIYIPIKLIIKEYISYFFNEENNTIDKKFKSWSFLQKWKFRWRLGITI